MIEGGLEEVQADDVSIGGIYLEVHQNQGGHIQIVIKKTDAETGGHGYRICGPKFTVQGSHLMRRIKLTKEHVVEIRRYLDLVQ